MARRRVDLPRVLLEVLGVVYDTGATLVDLREAVPTLEDTERIARRVLGGAHPFVSTVEGALRESRAVLRAREDGKSVVFEYAKRGLA